MIDVALIYDFDGTLAHGNMQEYGFIKNLGMTNAEFWSKCQKLSEKNDASSILCYMKTMLKEAEYHNIKITKEQFRRFGESVELFVGVEAWFKEINEYGKKRGLNVKHFINSSGLKEMIEGTKIAHEFEQIFACSFIYDANGVAEWPAVAVDFTSKTQFMFKINKGIREIRDDKRINEYIDEAQRPLPFNKMIYFGDGETDIPCMKLVKQKGGYSIAVYSGESGESGEMCSDGASVATSKQKQKRAFKLISDDRVNFVCNADYTTSGELYKVVTTILDKMQKDHEFDLLLKRHKEMAVRVNLA